MLDALRGVRVLDLTRILAGPFGTLLLADLGAEVIKVERLDGDEMRGMGPEFRGGESVYFMAVNRGKSSVCIDLSRDEGRRVLHDLAAHCDVLVENFRPGVAARVGCDRETLARVNPRLIVCGMTAFGREGDGCEQPAFDLTVQARGGTMGITGEPGRMPVRIGPPIGDLAGGMYAALAVAAALYERTRTGRGTFIDLALLDCQASLLVYAAAFALNGGVVLGPQGSAHAHATPYQAFETADLPIVVAVFTDRFWPGFCRALGFAAWVDDPRFATHALRRTHHEAWLPVAASRLRTGSADTWLAALQREEVPCAPVQPVDRVVRDPVLVARNMIATVEHPTAGTVRSMGNPMKLGDGWRDEAHAPAPRLGEHTTRVLRDVAAYDPARIEALRTGRVIT